MKNLLVFILLFVVISCKKESATVKETEPINPNVELIKGTWIEDSTQTLTSTDNGSTTIVVSSDLSSDTIEITANEFIFSGGVSYIYNWSNIQDNVFELWGSTKVDSLTIQTFIWTPSYYMLNQNSEVIRHYCHKL